MRIARRPLIMMGAAMAFGGIAARGEMLNSFFGEWFGVLSVGSTRLRLRLVVIAGPRAELYSLDQGNTLIPAATTRLEGERISIDWPALKARYEGRLSGGQIVGQFTQGGTLPLTFSRSRDSLSPVRVEPLNPARLAKLRADAGAPALAAAARNRNGRRVSLVDGLRVSGQPHAATTSDTWHIGSNTKSLTATLVARAVEVGPVSWHDTIGKVLGSSVPGMRPEYREITYRHLLSHRSGLPANIDVTELIKFSRESADARADRTGYARIALHQPPAGRKESHFEYSNSGYVIAGAMLEAQLGTPWEALMRERVFAPLGMASAGFGAPGKPGAYDQPAGHTLNALGVLVPYPPGAPVTDNPAVMGPAGRMHASLEDLLKYLHVHCVRAPFLREASWQTLHTPPFGGDYSLGWVRRDGSLWHNGSNTLWYCEMLVDPVRGIVATAVANDGRVGMVTGAVGEALMGGAEAVA